MQKYINNKGQSNIYTISVSLPPFFFVNNDLVNIFKMPPYGTCKAEWSSFINYGINFDYNPAFVNFAQNYERFNQ